MPFEIILYGVIGSILTGVYYELNKPNSSLDEIEIRAFFYGALWPISIMITAGRWMIQILHDVKIEAKKDK